MLTDLKPLKQPRFPAEFLLGAATAAHQVEGDNRASDWWEYEAAGRLPHASGIACDHYRRYEEDFDLAASWGHNAHRLSLEWSRIEPREGHFDRGAVEHYRAVLEALRQRGLEPIVTLHHFTNPAWFLARGGWTRTDCTKLFARYVDFIAGELGTAVRYWITINEPTVYAMHGYILGEWPPCKRSSWSSAARVLRNMARAHRIAYACLKQGNSQAQVGFAHSAPFLVPCNPRRVRDRLATRVRDGLLNGLFLRLSGGAHTLDFLGVNYYNRILVRSTGLGVHALLGRSCKAPHHADRGPLSQTGWEAHAPGLYAVLHRLGRLGVPLIVTENGFATDDEALRERCLVDHLKSLRDAMDSGVDVRGYLYWSLMDNYEWAEGARPHFGLASVEPVTLTRVPRNTAEVFASICRDREPQ